MGHMVLVLQSFRYTCGDSQVPPQPVIQAVPPGLSGVDAIVPGDILVPEITSVARTTAISLGVKPGGWLYSGC